MFPEREIQRTTRPRRAHGDNILALTERRIILCIHVLPSTIYETGNANVPCSRIG